MVLADIREREAQEDCPLVSVTLTPTQARRVADIMRRPHARFYPEIEREDLAIAGIIEGELQTFGYSIN